jgi:acyl-CoA synthetase (AMP-forming)/AMP-acid ligase II
MHANAPIPVPALAANDAPTYRSSANALLKGGRVDEAERILDAPAVAEAAVLSCAGADQEETIVAHIEPGAARAGGELIAYCRTRLSAHKPPQQIQILSQLPKNAVGTAAKFALASCLAGTTESAVESGQRHPLKDNHDGE